MGKFRKQGEIELLIEESNVQGLVKENFSSGGNRREGYEV